jgi:hypothetical protein
MAFDSASCAPVRVRIGDRRCARASVSPAALGTCGRVGRTEDCDHYDGGDQRMQ